MLPRKKYNCNNCFSCTVCLSQISYKDDQLDGQRQGQLRIPETGWHRHVHDRARNRCAKRQRRLRRLLTNLAAPTLSDASSSSIGTGRARKLKCSSTYSKLDEKTHRCNRATSRQGTVLGGVPGRGVIGRKGDTASQVLRRSGWAFRRCE